MTLQKHRGTSKHGVYVNSDNLTDLTNRLCLSMKACILLG